MKKNLKVLFLFFCMAIFFSACAGDTNSPNATLPSSSQSTQEENPLSPGNLPPPGSEEEVAGATAENSNLFFQRKELWDSFSDELKARVTATYQDPSLKGAGPGGMGYYNTLFGRVSPIKELKRNTFTSGGKIVYKTQSGHPYAFYSFKMKSGSNCDSFLCVDNPIEGTNTVVDSIIVEGVINMSDAGLFLPTDPVIMVSVFRQSGSYISSDIPIYGNEIKVTAVPGPNPEDPSVEWGAFQKTIPLFGAGTYSITVTALQNTGDGATPFSKQITIIRQDVPKVELINIIPSRGAGTTGNLRVEAAHRYSPVNSGDNVAMNYADVNVRLLSQGTQNVGIKFENLDDAGLVRYVSAGGEFKVSDQEPKLPLKTATLPLFHGYNKIRVSAYNPIMDYLNLSPSERSSFEVTLQNTLPKVSIKMISPQQGWVVEAKQVGENIPIQFCLTDLFSIQANSSEKAPGECITNWQGEAPQVIFNNFEYKDSYKNAITYNASSGIYTLLAKPVLGGNNIQVSVTNKALVVNPLPRAEDPQNGILDPIALGKTSASFVYGKVNKLFENGAMKEKDNFLSRGLSIEINKKLVSTDVKKIILKFLNKEDFKDTFINAFKTNTPGVTSICSEGGEYTVNTGDSTINILPETLKLGSFEIIELSTNHDGKLHLGVQLNGFTAEADLRGLNSNVKLVHNGKDYGFIPLSITIDKLILRAGIKFVKDENGYSKLDITAPSSGKAVELVGGDGLGNSVHVNSNRNPWAEGLEVTDVNGGLLQASFDKSLNKTIVCGIENGLNNTTTGLGQWRADLEKLVSYNNLNPFRIPLEFELLNKLVGLDIAYDLLRANIQFSGRGITIRDIPLRITPSPRILNALPDALKNTLMGSLSMPVQFPELAPSLPQTSDDKNLSLSLSEDAINQALFAATLAGMLDLDIDPNFYTNNGLSFFNGATPTVRDMFGQAIDFNQNGINDDGDEPVLMRMRPNRMNPPTIHFLTAQEVVDLKAKVDSVNSVGSSPKDSKNTAKTLNLNAKYFRISISNLDIAFYRVLPIGEENGGVKTRCFLKDPEKEPEADYNQRPFLPDFQGGNVDVQVCRQLISYDYEKGPGESCKEGFIPAVIPVKNGAVISAVPGSAEEVPVIRFKGNIILHGVIQGVFRETLAKNKYEYNLDAGQETEKLKPVQNPQMTNFVRIRFLSKELGPARPFANFALEEAHTTLTDISKDFSNQLTETLIPFALGEDCQNLNELNIPIPDKLPKEKSEQPVGFEKTLQDFGVDYLDLGLSTQHLPELQVGSDEVVGNGYDSANLYMNLKINLGICYLGEACQ